MEKMYLQSVYFDKLKSLHEVALTFEKPLTAIMGVNGSGKTTVIHALACVYKPDDGGHGENHRFPEFFVPNSDSLWNGSKFHVVNKVEKERRGWEVQPSKTYSKDFDRWAPRYESRPKRNVYYIGIDTCLPEIEKNTTVSRIQYISESRSDRLSNQVIEAASYILNKDYSTLVDNQYRGHHFLGVCTRSGLRYSSLSMGTGEQRTLKILEKVFSAEAYSLILIDEIDLLLHVSALLRLIKKLHNIALSKHLQIIFTTHSLEILNLQQYVGLQYLHTVTQQDGTDKIFVFTKPNDDIIRNLSGESNRPVKIYVEDIYSQTIIKYLLKKRSVSKKSEVIKFGSAHNAFSLAAGFILSNQDTEHTLIVIDGDEYATEEQKAAQIAKAMSGTEEDLPERQLRALSLIKQYALPSEKSPEEFIYDLLLKVQEENEIVSIAREIHAVQDKHDFVNYVCEQLQEPVASILPQVIKMIERSPEWQAYIAPLDEWIQAQVDA